MSMSTPPSVNIARLTYLLICEAAGIAIALSTQGGLYEISLTTGVVGGLSVAAVFILVESLTRGFSLRGFSTATFGLAVGLFCAWLLTRVQISNLVELAFREQLESEVNAADLVSALKLAFDVTLYASLGFLGAVLALRGSRDDFAFIVPYVRFRQDASSGQPIVVDADVVIDGRVIKILKSGFLSGRLIVPKFVLDELQMMADSKTPETQGRGQRGLTIMEEIKNEKDIQLSIHDTQDSVAGDKANSIMVEVARLLNARLLTVDDSLAKFARLQGVDVLNMYELDEALKPSVEAGQRVRIPLVRNGKDEGQAIGYLSDGTMIVVNQGVAKVGETVEVVVTSTLQTASGKMIFAELCKPS